jgi:hypothetical protein
MRRRTLLVGSFLIPASLSAQANDPRSVQPERPTVATHAHTVAPGFVELEAGAQGDALSGRRSWSAPLVLKLGLAEHLQLNLYAPLFFSGAGVRSHSGVGDLAVGLKWRLLDDHAVLGDFAVLPVWKFPTASASDDLGSGEPDAGITFISSHDLNGVAMDLNVTVARLGVGSDDATTSALWTASFGFPVVGRLSWVGELFGSPAIDGAPARPTVMLLTGPSYLVSTALALDVGIITRLHGDGLNSIYAGFVWNLGRLWPSAGATSLRSHPSRLVLR